MKRIKINFTGMCSREGFNAYDNPIVDLLRKNYDVEISDEPDYVFCGVLYPGASYVHGIYHEYLLNYSCIRIMIQGENFIPDFNIVDYAITQYPINFFDRNLYFPGGIEAFVNRRFLLGKLQEKNRDYGHDFLESKCYFASFIASHDSKDDIRGRFFKKLNQIKRVESAGTYLNNMPNGEIVHWEDGSKLEFLKKCKFSLCFECTVEPGFITEKIVEAFYCDTIPIYYGSSNIKDIFNPDAFIDVSDYKDFDSVIEKIIEIENDDNKYLEMLRQPIFNDTSFPKKIMTDLENYLIHIFEQPVEQAYRRSDYLTTHNHEEFLKRAVENELGIKELWTNRQILHYLKKKNKTILSKKLAHTKNSK